MPWAKGHSWQSWRERYKKNQDWYNYQIKKYQKKLRVCGTDSTAYFPSLRQLAKQEAAATRKKSEKNEKAPKKPEESEETSVNESEVREELYAELFGISQSSEEDEDESDRSPQQIHNKPKRIVPRDDDNNFFGTPSPSPSLPATNSAAKRKLPILHEGPYRNSLKRSRTASGDATKDESWPPKRRKKTTEDIDVSPNVEMLDARGKVETKKVVSATQPATGAGSANGLTRRSPAQVNAVASSSKIEPPHRHAKPTNLLKVICTKQTSSAMPLPKAIEDTDSCLIIDKTNNGRVTSLGSRNSVPIIPMRSLTLNDSANAALRLPSIFPEDGDDPFIANKPLDKAKADTTPSIDNLNLQDIPSRRIDLRESLNATRRSCNLSSRTSTSSASDHSITSLLPEDQELINGVGFMHVMATIAKHYGFDEDVAKRAFYKTNSIEKTKDLLQRCNEVLCDMLARRDDVDSSGDEAPQSMRRGHSSSRKNKSNSNSGSQKAKSSSSSRRAIRPSLHFKPRPFDEKIDIALSDYSPPHVSRAGQFNRLVKQGRREEAIDRERRRASGVFVAQTQTQSYDEAQRQQSLSPLPNSSPLQSCQETIDIDGCDDVQSFVKAPHEDTVQNQPPDDTSSPVDHRIFFKRISEGQSTLNEDEDDPAMLQLAQEHRDLVMNVTEENADELRCFEQKNNQDLLRLWSLEWVRQKIADM